jgi:hypothetical protein
LIEREGDKFPLAELRRMMTRLFNELEEEFNEN